MSNFAHDNDTGLADFTAGWRKALEDREWITVTFAVIGLTNFGERPVQSTRLAEALGRSVNEAEALAQAVGLARNAVRGRPHLRRTRAREVGAPASSPDR
jgi:hypothetical protein